MPNNNFDIVIVGSGPAGLTASIYASRYKLSNLVIGKTLGGMMTYAHKIENYPGFNTISGVELGRKMGEQVKALGAQIIPENVAKIEKNDDLYQVTSENSRQLFGRSLIVATGTERRKLNIPGEEEYLGRGVSYCTNCDAPFFKGRVVGIIGGADSAVSGAIHTAEFAEKVYIIYRGGKLRAEPVWTQEAEKNPKIEVIYNTNITQIIGDDQQVIGVKLDKPYQGKDNLPLGGVFIEIGGIPVNSLLKPLGTEIDENGYIQVGLQMETNQPGLFAAGDVANRCGEFQQITVACSEGSLAAASAFKFLKGESAPKLVGSG